MRHEEAFKRLPDLLDDRDDGGLLAHVRACADCQRQLFLLGRVDRMLRDSASAHGAPRRRQPTVRHLLAAAAVVAAAAAITFALILPQTAHTHEFVLKTASGRSVGTSTRTSRTCARGSPGGAPPASTTSNGASTSPVKVYAISCDATCSHEEVAQAADNSMGRPCAHSCLRGT